MLNFIAVLRYLEGAFSSLRCKDQCTSHQNYYEKLFIFPKEIIMAYGSSSPTEDSASTCYSSLSNHYRLKRLS